MSRGAGPAAAGLWEVHDREWRDPAAVAAQWREAGDVDPRLLEHRTAGDFWKTLHARGIVLLVTREYEHLLIALSGGGRGARVSYLGLPHPSGLAIDPRRGVVHVASTRNPNQIYDLRAVRGSGAWARRRVLVPVRTRYFPGASYIHDLAMVGGQLHANAVGQNAVVRISPGGGCDRVWWPRSIEVRKGAAFSRNYLQLNSIAAGRNLAASFFSASAARPGRYRPGQLEFPVDRRGVVFSGRTRDVVAGGLTRPHSARLHRGRLWVDNSGYGQLGVVARGAFEPVFTLPGWTRGLALLGDLAIVGTSRVLPRFQCYAPGLEVDKSECGLHLLDIRTGRRLGSLIWPLGNQIFAIEAVPVGFCDGLPFEAGKGPVAAMKDLFFSYQPVGR